MRARAAWTDCPQICGLCVDRCNLNVGLSDGEWSQSNKANVKYSGSIESLKSLQPHGNTAVTAKAVGCGYAATPNFIKSKGVKRESVRMNGFSFDQFEIELRKSTKTVERKKCAGLPVLRPASLSIWLR